MKQKDKPHFEFVFVVLVYRNTDDLADFFKYNKVRDSHIIVVNSFFDKKSEQIFNKLATDNGADFISIANKGYGAGNNAGIDFALKHFSFHYLIISNADVVVRSFDKVYLKKYAPGIIAPKLISSSGKNQNPSSPYKPNGLYERYRYIMFKNRHTKLIWLAYAYSRLMKSFFYLLRHFKKEIFSAHGAFVILHYNVIKQLHPIYNERMFLFNEEEHLGRLAEQHCIHTWYEPSIVIHHKEDGSMKIASVNEFERARESFIEYYNYWQLDKC